VQECKCIFIFAIINRLFTVSYDVMVWLCPNERGKKEIAKIWDVFLKTWFPKLNVVCFKEISQSPNNNFAIISPHMQWNFRIILLLDYVTTEQKNVKFLEIKRRKFYEKFCSVCLENLVGYTNFGCVCVPFSIRIFRCGVIHKLRQLAAQENICEISSSDCICWLRKLTLLIT
jgi:hypothetical protein